MNPSLDLDGRVVLVVGDADPVRRIVARAAAAGASVSVRPPGPGAVSGAPVRPDLVVWAAGEHPARAAVAASARAVGAVLATDEPLTPTPNGHVTLVGGGPGDPELITVAGRRALADADVVLHDRLGPRAHVAALAPGAELVDVGKTPGHHAVPQHEIERIMLEHAVAGRRVVRLKGGDPFVFGRGGEEVSACRAAGVPVTVVPGVTSAIAVPAEAGIPVTHRELSRAFTVLSGHVPFSEDELRHLAGLGGTIVLLMAVGTVHQTMAGLARHGLAADTPVAFLERGCTPDRRVVVATLGTAGTVASLHRFTSPAVIVVGEVVRLSGAAETLADVVPPARIGAAV